MTTAIGSSVNVGKMKFKVLVYKNGTTFQEFMHFNYEANVWCTSSTPDLRPMTLTMELVKEHFPPLNLEDVTLETVEVKIIEE